MADVKAIFVPGSQINEAATGNIFIYVEAMETIKNGEEVDIDMKFGRARHPENMSGVRVPFGMAAENLPKGQFGQARLPQIRL